MENLTIRDGSSQEERLLPALLEGYINVDEMRFEDLLSMAAEYAGLLKYTDSANQTDGDWRAFFETDEACILSSLLATNLNLIEADFFRFLRESEAMLEKLREGSVALDILPTFKLARKIDSWYIQLNALSSVAAVRASEKIAGVIENTLRDKLQQLHIFFRENHAEDSGDPIREFSSIWLADASVANVQKDSKQFLKANFYAFYNAVLYLQGCVADILIVSLGRHNHDPALGLYIAFLKLFKKVQGKINEFTLRHLNFYYEDVLKIQRREFVPDSAHLLFYPDTVGKEILIKKDTEFVAGLDENRFELFYTADNDLLVNDAKVCSLFTLYFGRNELSSPENSLKVPAVGNGAQQQFVTSAKLNRIEGFEGNISATTDGFKAQPLFGVPPRSREKRMFEEAKVGFAVASSALLLKQGQRDITLTFKFGSDEQEMSLDVFTDELSKILATTVPDAFFKAFRHMFNISLTGESGWLEIDEYLPLSHLVDEKGCEANSLKIQVSLPDSASGVVPYTAETHGGCFDTELPIIKFEINPDAYLYSYSLLCELVVKEIVIEVAVKGCSDALIYNQLGVLSTNAQFNPFGATPSVGDYLIIGNYEAARKKLISFEVDIEWANLPQETGGFEEYYRAYPMPFANEEFRVHLTSLRDRKWIPTRDGEQLNMDLFESAPGPDKSEYKKVSKKRRISFQGLCKFLRPLENITEEQYGYDAMTKDGFFKLTLKTPGYAFGHKDYPMVLSDVMTENAKLKRSGFAKLFRKELPPKPLPNSPYTPLVNSILINYKAVSHISLEHVSSEEEERLKEKLFHLHPLGSKSLSPKAYGKIRCVPRYETDGNLFIGLSGTNLAGQLTLFFHLREDSLPEAGAMTFEFTWYYLASNQWKRLEKSQVLSDTTNGFLSSGIVTLDIPDDIDCENTILPGRLFWIRVSVNDRHMHTLCSLYGVHTHALKASWKRLDGNSLTHLDACIPAGTINEARFSIPGLGKIHQIMDSFGGAPPESDRQRTIRVSERLRHKNRAITAWDYERLILQRFPEIYKAKCFSCMNSDAAHGRHIKPGHVLIVLIPYLKESASVNLQPMVNALLLREVKEFVKGISSDFVKINVRNPSYEQIQVRCKVKFRQGARRGFYLNELNQEIVNYLSPWSSTGLEAKFGWRIRCNDIQSHIHGFPYVASVSGLSLLQIREGDDRKYQLSDTARRMVSEAEPAYPWSIAIPVRRHLIEVVDENDTWPSEETGIADLAIGSTFILSRGVQ